jgi:hypothetical protein
MAVSPGIRPSWPWPLSTAAAASGGSVSSDSLLPFVQAAVAPGAVVRTDGWSGYASLPTLGYDHRVTNLKRRGRAAHELMPLVHHVASLLNRWLLGTHHWGVQPFQLDYYLDEFTFWFNRRSSRARGLLFHRLAQQTAATDPAPYHRLVAPRASRRVNS